MTAKKDTFKTSDIYQSAYLLSLGCSVEGVEVAKELDKDVCILTLKGESLKKSLESYLTGKALVEPQLYQKALIRIKDVVFKALSKVQGGKL